MCMRAMKPANRILHRFVTADWMCSYVVRTRGHPPVYDNSWSVRYVLSRANTRTAEEERMYDGLGADACSGPAGMVSTLPAHTGMHALLTASILAFRYIDDWLVVELSAVPSGEKSRCTSYFHD